MSSSLRRTAVLAFAGLATLGVLATPAQAQRTLYRPSPLAQPQQIPYPVNPNQAGFLSFNNTPQQRLYQARMLGRSIRAIPPYAFGYNPYPSPIINYGPVVPPVYPPVTPYDLSTVPGGYGGGYPSGSTLSTSPYGGYGLSTVGSGSGYGGYGGGFGDYSPGGTLQGAGAYTESIGKYNIAIQQASLVREQRRQMALDTARKEAQLAAYLDSIRLTHPQMREREAATELDRARKDPPRVEVWSGKALNELLRSIQRAGRNNLSRGPKIELESDTLTHINLSDKASQGNAGLLKHTDKNGSLALLWPAALEGAAFADAQQRLTLSLREAVDRLKKGDRPPQTTLKDIQGDFDTIKKKLDETADDLTPSQYIAATRYLKQLDEAIRALRDPKAANHFNATWKARGATVAELVENMTKDGLEFAAATPGDEASYTAMYQALRGFEGGLLLALNTKQQ